LANKRCLDLLTPWCFWTRSD